MTALFAIANFFLSTLIIILCLSQFFGYNYEKERVFIKNNSAAKILVIFIALCASVYNIFAPELPNSSNYRANNATDRIADWIMGS